MNLEELYVALHGDYAEAKSRLMSDKLVGKFVMKFPADPSMQQLRDAVAAGDNATAFRASHTLKGVAANLAFTRLKDAASLLTEQMRGKDVPADEELLSKVEEAYDQVIANLSTYSQEKGT